MAAMVLMAACAGTAGGGVAPADRGPVGGADVDGDAAVGQPWIRGRVDSMFTTKPVLKGCVPEADQDGDGAVSSNDPPVCDATPDSYGSLMVKGVVQGQPGRQPASVHVGKDVPIENADGSKAIWGDLRKGTTVSVWITGEVMKSYPVQVGATKLVIE